jgi:CHAT domain-containing protein
MQSPTATLNLFNGLKWLAILAILAVLIVCPVHAQSRELHILNQQYSQLMMQGNNKQATIVAAQALTVVEKTRGPDHPDIANQAGQLAQSYAIQGQYVQASALHRRALAIREKSYGAESPQVAISLSMLASLYNTQGFYAQAELLHKRVLAIREKSVGTEHRDVAWALGNLAWTYSSQGKYAQAEPLYKRALAIREKSNGAESPEVASSLYLLARLYSAQGQYAQAEPLFKRAVEISEKSEGTDHATEAMPLIDLADLYRAQGQHAQAEPLYKRALLILEEFFAADSHGIAMSLNGLAANYDAQGQYPQALAQARRVTAIYRNRIVAAGSRDGAARVASSNQEGFLRHLLLLARNADQEPISKVADEAFQLMQVSQASGTAAAIAKMADRFANGDDELATLIKRKQDAAHGFVRLEAQLLTAVSQSPQRRNAAAEQQLRDEVAATGKEIALVDAELSSRFPNYQELTRPEPLAVAQVRALLKPGEAMLAYELGSSAAGDSSFAWVVKADGDTIFMKLSVKANEVADQVATVRAQMELNQDGKLQKVSVDVLHDLYRGLVAPVEAQLRGVNHILVVPTGPLQSLPFGMLVASAPPRIARDMDYARVDWIAKRYATSVLPSVSSIQAFRQFAKGGNAQEPFAGFGDPSIGEQSGSVRGKGAKLAKIDIAAAYRNLRGPVNGDAPVVASTAEIADVEVIRRASSLPDTATELRAMAKTLKAGEQAIWLRDDATETRVKQSDLSKYRILAFSTHGVIAGQLKGVGEPGLILTPPKVGTVEDDGYLSSGEIAKLKLNADWVILSACNTAASDGTPGAEGLSGMAKAFFYAGARSLLVSHWPVASEATVPLTTHMLKEFDAHPNLGKARAQQKAMLELMHTKDHPEYAHPLFWAPFVVVGEGG